MDDAALNAMTLKPLSKRDRGVATIVTAWRRLTTPESASTIGPGEWVVAACSGGADSSALVLALAAATPRVVVAHVMHDFRSEGEVGEDERSVRALAGALGLAFVSARIRAATMKGNAEANARRGRYEALLAIARRTGCRFVATGHHGLDQVETVVMGLLRGAGPAGLAGIAQRRELTDRNVRPLVKGVSSAVVEMGEVQPKLERAALGEGERVVLIRPMLGVDATVARRLCTEAGWAWREDGTNGDVSRTRAAVRYGLVPEILKIRPDAARRAVAAAGMFAEAERLIRGRGAVLWRGRREVSEGGVVVGVEFEVARLRREEEIVIAHVLRRAFKVVGDGALLGRLTRAHTDGVVAAVMGARTRERREFSWPGASVYLFDRERVVVMRTPRRPEGWGG